MGEGVGGEGGYGGYIGEGVYRFHAMFHVEPIHVPRYWYSPMARPIALSSWALSRPRRWVASALSFVR